MPRFRILTFPLLAVALSVKVGADQPHTAQDKEIWQLIAGGAHEAVKSELANASDPKTSVDAIAWALQFRQQSLAEDLLEGQIDRLEIQSAADLLVHAVTYNAPGVVQTLLEANDNFRNHTWKVPLLQIAAKEGAYHAAIVLLEWGLDHGLLQAANMAILTGNPDLVWLLFSKLELSELAANNDHRFLRSAIYAGQLTVLQHLFDEGFNVNTLDPNGVHVALLVGRPDSHAPSESRWSQEHIYRLLVASGLDECLMVTSFDESNIAQIQQYSPEWFKLKVADLARDCAGTQ